MMALIGVLAVLCAVIFAALRRQPALLWMGAALAVGMGESFALKDGTISLLDTFLVCFTVPASYICVGQSIRAAYGEPVARPFYFVSMGGLVALSLVLRALEAPPVMQALFFQMAGVVAMIDAIACMMRQPGQPDRIDKALLWVVAAVALVFVARIPFFPVLLNQPTPFGNIDREAMQAVLLGVFGVLVPACVILVVARVVTNAVDTHRLLAERDHMTGLLNRRSFEDVAAKETNLGGMLVLADIDHFKQVNDRFGHAAGDAVIRAFAELIDGPGTVARIGGEEFAIWLPCHDEQGAVAHAEKLRREFGTMQLLDIDPSHTLSASFGIAPVKPGVPMDLVIAQADAALYCAKNAGRNRVVLHCQDVEPLRRQAPRKTVRAIRAA